MDLDPDLKVCATFAGRSAYWSMAYAWRKERLQSEDRFTLFDLGRQSLLEPISANGNRFRVAWYDPRLMARTHHPGVHQYLVAKEVVEADVIINLPKLKTHRKAGVTCALKNLIGINGNKEYLPHHRVGGSQSGGDCYPGNGAVKRALEYLSDRQNLTSSYAAGMLWRLLFAVFARTSRARGIAPAPMARGLATTPSGEHAWI